MSCYQNAFVRFAHVEADESSSLYKQLALAVAEDDELLTLTDSIPDDQPAPNLLFAAVQYLLFDRPDEPLAVAFPSISTGASTLDTDTYEAFRNFCLNHRERLTSLFQSRRVQTNVVRRSSVLFPVFKYVAQRRDHAPLGLVEIGASAGLNLLWDRYGYEYDLTGPYGDPTSPVQLSCTVRDGGMPPLSTSPPQVGSRIGLDLNTLDCQDEADAQWLRALVWPEHDERRQLLDGAISLAHDSPPTLIEGDALNELHSVCERVPDDNALCLFNTHVLYQFTSDQQQAFEGLVDELGDTRDLFWANCEWHGETPEVRYVEYTDGDKSTGTLARYDAHGRWLEWLH